MKRTLLLLILATTYFVKAQNTSNNPIVLAYFPSWSESYASSNQNSKLREIPSYVNYVFLSFAKPDMIYEKGSYDISKTGIEVPYDGCTLKESVSALKAKKIKVILSVGGETYWTDDAIYDKINYQQIKDLVDDMGFAGIDWDYEPNGSFANIGTAENVKHFQDFFIKSRAIMPKSEGYILACAPSGVGALGGQQNDDSSSPYSFNKRNEITGEDDTNLYVGTASTNGINLFGFGATGHMIPVIKKVGDKIDIIAYQGYNAGGSQNRKIMYDAYAYYANAYGFKVVAGIHYPNEPWGPYYEYTHENVAELASHIYNHPDRKGTNDGIMIWQLLLSGANSSAYSYMNVASKVLNGVGKPNAIADANNFEMQKYEGGASGCNGAVSTQQYCGVNEYNPLLSYPTSGTKVYADCSIWQNKWWANPNEAPGNNSVWEIVESCTAGEGCTTLGLNSNEMNTSIQVYQDTNSITIQNESNEPLQFIELISLDLRSSFKIKGGLYSYKILKQQFDKGIYVLRLQFSDEIVTKKLIIK